MSLFCPECRATLPHNSENTRSCQWKPKKIKGIDIYLKNAQSEVFKKYLENYETISKDDLSNSILPEDYIQLQAEKILKHVDLSLKGKICNLGGGRGYL